MYLMFCLVLLSNYSQSIKPVIKLTSTIVYFALTLHALYYRKIYNILKYHIVGFHRTSGFGINT